jgi:hypothetical protein
MENALNLCLIGFSLYYDRKEFVHEVGGSGVMAGCGCGSKLPRELGGQSAVLGLGSGRDVHQDQPCFSQP